RNFMGDPTTNLRGRSHRVWNFWCQVNTNNPVRRILNQTLAKIAGITALLAILKLIRFVNALVTLNNELKQRVSERTAELAEANALIERRAALRAQQDAAAVHDLRNTTVAIDAILTLLELDVEDTQTTLATVTSERDSVDQAIFSMQTLIEKI